MGIEDDTVSEPVSDGSEVRNQGPLTLSGLPESPDLLAAVETPVAPVPEPETFVRAREAVHRPPLPPVGLYDAFLPKPTTRLRRSCIDDHEAQSASGPVPPTEDARMARVVALPVSSDKARNALEAWSTGPSRHASGKRKG